MDWEIEFEKEQEEKHKLATKIWDIPFAVANLHKLTKKELLMLIQEMLERIRVDYKQDWFEYDIKDIMFEQKCWIIEALDPNFFTKEKQK